VRSINGLAGSFLAAVDPSTVDAIRQRAVVHHHPSGGIVVSEDDGKWTGIVLSGMARVFLRTPDGRQVTLRHARAGGSIGIGALLGEGAVSAQAVTDCRVMRLDHEQVARLAEQDVRLALAIAQEVSVRLMETYHEIVVRERGSLRQRLARQLLHFAGEQGEADQPLVLPMSHEELADAVGSAREVVSRHLARFQSEDIVALDRGRITLIDPIRLDETARRLG
jgi:CRP/FNR family transcriptional regulator